MAYVFVSPSWFFIYSIILEIFFAIITFILSYYAFKVYKLTDQRQSKLFSAAFLLISLSYLAQAILNLVILEQLADRVVSIINLQNVFLLNLFGLYAHALLFIMGLLVLAYLTLRLENINALFLGIAVIIVSIYMASNKTVLFYLLSTILLVSIVINYFMIYAKSRNTNTLLVLLSMIFLLFGTLHFLFALNNSLYYVIGHVLEFIAYLIMLVNLLVILNNGKKKR